MFCLCCGLPYSQLLGYSCAYVVGNTELGLSVGADQMVLVGSISSSFVCLLACFFRGVSF